MSPVDPLAAPDHRMDNGPADAPSELDALLDQVLAAPDAQWHATLEALCGRYPEHADALRRRFACLHDHGVIAAPLRALPHGSVFGDYELGAILGHGAMGVVFDAVHRPTGEPVALKVLRPELLDETKAQQRFRQEAEVAARLDHPHLCRVRGAGTVEGTPFLAMQRIVGDTLADRILRARRHGKTAAPSVLGLAHLIEKVARGLGHLHQQGLVHRDVKPGNILVTAAGEPVLCDFGLAWSSAAARLTRTGTALGTPAYMAPEQVRGEDEVTASADVYSLGATLYESLALRPPFESVQREDLYRRILGDDADDVRKWNPAVPRSLAVVVGCCLEKDPRRRYANGDALAADLERARAGRPVAAREAGPLRRLARTIRRHPVAASLLLAAALGLAGSSLFAWQKGRQASMEAVLASLSAERLGGLNPLPAALIAREAYEQEPCAATRSALLASLLGLHQCDEVPNNSGLGWSAELPDGRLLCAVAGASEWPKTSSSLAGTWPGVVVHGCYNGVVSPGGGHYALFVGRQEDPQVRLFATGLHQPLADMEPPIAFQKHWGYRQYEVIDFDRSNRLYVGDLHGRVTVFESDGTLVASWVPHTGSCIRALWALDGGAVVTVGVTSGVDARSEVRVSSTGQPAGALLHTGAVSQVPLVAYGSQVRPLVAISGDRRRLFLGLELGSDMTARVACVPLDGTPVSEFELPARCTVEAIAVDEHGDSCVVGTGRRNMVFLLQRDRTGPDRFCVQQAVPLDSVPCTAAFGPRIEGMPQRYAVGEWSGLIHVYTQPGGDETVLRGHANSPLHLRFSADGSELVSSSAKDGTVRRWRLELPGLPIATAADPVLAVDWLPDGEHFVVATGHGELSLFDRRARLLDTDHDGNAVFGLVRLAVAAPNHPLAPGEVVIALCGGKRPLSLWACRPGAEDPLRVLRVMPRAEGTPGVLSLRFTRQHFLIAGRDEGVEILGADGQAVWSSDHGDRVWHVDDVAVSSNGLVACGGGLGVSLWQLRQAAGAPELERGPVLECEGKVSAIAFPPDDDGTLLVGLFDGRVLWFQLANGTRRLVGYHDRGVRAVAFTSDGTRMLSSGQDGVIKVWTRKRELFVELTHGGVVHWAAFSPDGRHVLTGSSNRTARIWPVTDEELGRLARTLPFRGLERDERQRLLFGGR